MGKLIINKLDKKTDVTSAVRPTISKKTEMYKPISEFAWKDASRAEIHQNSINAYKKYAF